MSNLDIIKDCTLKIGYSYDTDYAEKGMKRATRGKRIHTFCKFQVKFINAKFIETKIHEWLDNYRDKETREFFSIKYSIVKKVIYYVILMYKYPYSDLIDQITTYLMTIASSKLKCYDIDDEEDVINDLLGNNSYYDVLCSEVQYYLLILLGKNTFTKQEITKNICQQLNKNIFKYKAQIKKKDIIYICEKICKLR